MWVELDSGNYINLNSANAIAAYNDAGVYRIIVDGTTNKIKNLSFTTLSDTQIAIRKLVNGLDASTVV